MFLIFLILFTGVAYSEEINVETGFGYFVDSNGNVVCHATLNPGKHPIKDGYGYIEVSDKRKMEEVEIYVKPKTSKELAEENIAQKTREILRKQAIDELKKTGDLPDDYK